MHMINEMIYFKYNLAWYFRNLFNNKPKLTKLQKGYRVFKKRDGKKT